MDQARNGRAPVHLWIVGGLALLWSAFGCYDYVMTRMRNTDYLAAMMPTIDPNAALAWIDGFPIWVQAGWALGVWGGLVGAILLLARRRWAVPLFAASLVGVSAALAIAAPVYLALGVRLGVVRRGLLRGLRRRSADPES